MNPTFHIYKSSAGSGKTRTLTKQYLKIALSGERMIFKRILAITFTNKATQEMKDRILSSLRKFSQSEFDSMATELATELDITTEELATRSSDVLSSILHNYSSFSISTIDAFFQKVIRAFTQEVGIGGGYKLELDYNHVLEQVVNGVVSEVGGNKRLTNWVVDFSKNNLLQDKSWDIRATLRGFAQELMREDYKLIEDTIESLISEPKYYSDLQDVLLDSQQSFLSDIQKLANQVLDDMRSNGWNEDSFKYGGGAHSFFVRMSESKRARDLDDKFIGSRPRKEFLIPKNWPDSKAPDSAAITDAATQRYIPALTEILKLRDNGYALALSAEMLLGQFYAFGLMADIARHLREFKADRNILLLSDASRMLNAIIGGSDTPFIYEKIGAYYDYFLIDEFQDTSVLQWNNLKPLLQESLDTGKTGLIVGDEKQSIYRWRGGDLTLLQNNVQKDLGTERTMVHELSSNYRSAKHIVTFNNTVFESIGQRFANTPLVAATLSNVIQKPTVAIDGQVEVEFLESKNFSEWKQLAMDQTIDKIRFLRTRGVAYRDIAILVRKNTEGRSVAQSLTSLGMPVMSNESLLLASSPSVRLIIAFVKHLHNKSDKVSALEVLQLYGQLQKKTVDFDALLDLTEESFMKRLPEAIAAQYRQLPFVSLYELVETLIMAFGLDTEKIGEYAFLETLQSVVLDYMGRERNDLVSFLTYWESVQDTLAIQVPDTIDAIRVMSVHMSKGLQFKYVFIPFCQWDLDHPGNFGPILWVSGVLGNGYLPVKYSSSMKDSLFNDHYEEEKMRCLMDNINILYVALTRAELGLFIYAPNPEKVAKTENTIARILYDCIKSSDVLNIHIQDVLYRVGTFHQNISQDETQPKLVIKQYLAGTWRQKLSIKPHPSRQLDQEPELAPVLVQ